MTADPDECGLCRNLLKDSPGSNICINVRADGRTTKAGLCGECIRLLLLEMAHRNRQEFEAFVEEARNWKLDDPQGENSN